MVLYQGLLRDRGRLKGRCMGEGDLPEGLSLLLTLSLSFRTKHLTGMQCL